MFYFNLYFYCIKCGNILCIKNQDRSSLYNLNRSHKIKVSNKFFTQRENINLLLSIIDTASNWIIILENENGIRVASGMFIAVIQSPGLGQKVLKFAIIMPQKQVHY